MKVFRGRFISVFGFVLFLSVFEDASAARILFVGNSFTGFSMPVLRAFARASPSGTDHLEFQFVGGTNLEAHSLRSETIRAIQCKRFDYIVLQDHSQRTLIAPDSFRVGVSRLVSMAKAGGAQPLLFETWARGRGGTLNSFLFHQSIVSSAYHDIGAELDVPIIHVGDVWRGVHQTNRSLFNALYQSDLIHPTQAGQYAVATSVYRTLYPTDLTWAPSNGIPGHSQRAIRNIAIDLNSPLPSYTNPNSESVCDVSRDVAQRALCGCSAELPPEEPIVISPIINIILD